MTDTEAEALGKRLVASRHFRPLRGMLDMQGRTWDTSLLWRWNNDVDVPDLRDPATLGCVLELVRQAVSDPNACVDYSFAEPMWYVNARYEYEGHDVLGVFAQADTEAEALVAALEAAP